ncbi:DUF7793 family protein [Mesonia aestuariivivens]|uniref:DUF7793 domain-containing protein n=1 Tax=Mesonia aestuariivivens TaxID=2796128 RepID=A0ABS6W4X7_9FLAO|nr:hypothetical protein [Mesonia aestuariivivens]MBW2962920.1 hypothetical protein [Mesonia aestuariivivens]
MHNYIHTKYAEIYIKEGIVFFRYLTIEDFDEHVAKELVAIRLQLQREQTYPVLCDVRALNIPSKKARNYLSIEGSLLVSAIAYWADPHTTKELTDFFLKINPPLVPSAIFTAKEEAIMYLKAFIS